MVPVAIPALWVDDRNDAQADMELHKFQKLGGADFLTTVDRDGDDVQTKTPSAFEPTPCGRVIFELASMCQSFDRGPCSGTVTAMTPRTISAIPAKVDQSKLSPRTTMPRATANPARR